ncbi:MAG TPA: xanthine dehydrogenase family protein subunit M [Tepidiformaceae bacterium]|nr:xanthine dehydrogenase family protein subunit M [Tepidiformaceae bacterium]
MIPTEFDYKRAGSIDEAISLLRDSGGEGKFLAGGHSLIPLMKLRLSEPGVLIDISRIDQLKGIRETNGKLAIGAATTHTEVAESDLVRRLCPVIAEAAAEIGDPQVRNRGTLGGSLAHSDPAADYPAVMVALDAEIHIKGPGGWRTVQAGDFFQGMFTVDLAEDEIIAGVQVAPTQSAAYVKLHQRASHYAIVGVAAALEKDGNVCRSARIGLTGASTHAQRLGNVEQLLAGRELTQANIDAAATVAGDGLEDVNADIHASEAYRRAMVKVFTRRAIEEAARR